MLERAHSLADNRATFTSAPPVANLRWSGVILIDALKTMAYADTLDPELDQAAQAEQPIAKLYGQPVVEIPADLFIPPDALRVILEAFEGPLDLLLYLIRKHN